MFLVNQFLNGEKGGSLPDIDRLVTMSELFDISLDKLILGKDKNVQKVVLEKSPLYPS